MLTEREGGVNSMRRTGSSAHGNMEPGHCRQSLEPTRLGLEQNPLKRIVKRGWMDGRAGG